MPDSGSPRCTPTEARLLLSAVETTRRRTRDAASHNWLLAAILGAALVLGVQLDRLLGFSAGDGPCASALRVVPGSCARAALPSIPLARGPVSGASTGTMVSTVQANWTIGTNAGYWAAAFAAAFGTAFLLRATRMRRRWLGPAAALVVAAVAAGAGLDAALHALAPVSAAANVMAVGTLVALAAVFERSRGLFFVGLALATVAAATGAVMPAIVLPHTRVGVPPAAEAQAAAGLTMVVSALVLRWRSGVTHVRHRRAQLAGTR